jgi:hypothetical protein
MTLAIVENLIPRELSNNEAVFLPASDGQPDRNVPVGALASWTEPERNAVSVYTIGTDTTPIPSDKMYGGMELRYDQPSNTVKWYTILVDYPLSDRKQAMREEVNVRTVQQIEVGYNHDFGAGLGGVHPLDTRRELAAAWIDYRNACQEKIDAGQGSSVMEVPIRDKNDVDVFVRANQGMTCMQGMRTREGNITLHSRALRDQVRAAADHAALDAIDINAGWPA